MARSYGKKAEGITMWRGWHRCMRARERMCIHQEMMSTDNGDVIFPIVSEVSSPWTNDSYSFALYYYEKETRENYFQEIKIILNGYCDERRWRYSYPQQDFIKAFTRIKKGVCPDGKPSRFVWLNTREAKEAVKQWNGDPIDILHYLTSAGIIEKAVHNECKRMSRK